MRGGAGVGVVGLTTGDALPLTATPEDEEEGDPVGDRAFEIAPTATADAGGGGDETGEKVDP